MADDGTSFTIDIPVKGTDKIDAASTAVEVLAAKLDAASKAVKAGEASYRQAEASADRAAKALERVGIAAAEQRLKLQQATRAGDEKSIQRASDALELLASREARLAGEAEKTKKVLADEAKALDALRGNLDKADKAHKAAKEEADKAEPAYAKIGRGLGKLGGPLAEVGEKVVHVGEGFSKLRAALGGAGTVLAIATAFVAVAAAFVAVTAAAVGAIAKVTLFGVELANTKAHAERLAQAMLFGSKTGGAALNDQINALTRKLPLTQEEIANTARGLAYMGLRGKALNDALERSATWAARLKFGPDFQAEMLSLEEQSKVLQSNLARLFGGLNITPLLRGLQKLGALLDADTASGKAIKVVFESWFQPIVDWLAKSSTGIEAFFLRVEILALKAAIQFKLHFSTISKVVEAFAVGALIVFGLIAAAIGIVVASVGALVLGLGAVAIFFVKTLPELGQRIGDGLINGIKSAGPKIVAALKGVVTDAIAAAKKLLGIASPSKVFAEIGRQTGAGMEQGVMRSTPGVQQAFEGMVTPPSAGASAGKGGVHLENVRFEFHGVKGAEDAIEQFRAALISIVDGSAAQLAIVPAGGGPT